MTHYCHRCGRWRLLNVLTLWCSDCTDAWADRYQLARGVT